TEARRRAERVGMVDQPTPHERHRLEAAVRVLREAGNGGAVVHAPTGYAGEVGADLAAREGCVRTQRFVPGGVVVDVMHAEEERVDRRPLEPEGRNFEYRIVHGAKVREPESPSGSRERGARPR